MEIKMTAMRKRCRTRGLLMSHMLRALFTMRTAINEWKHDWVIYVTAGSIKKDDRLAAIAHRRH